MTGSATPGSLPCVIEACEKMKSVCASTPAKEEPAPNPKNSQWPQCCAAALACCVSLVNGASYGWPSVAQPLLEAAGSITEDEASWLASLLLLCSAASILPCAWLFPRCGRKTLGYLAGTCLGLHWLLLFAAGEAGGAMMLVARAFAGAAGASLFFFTPAYVREVAEESKRGLLGTFMSLFFNSGVLLMYVAGGLLSYQNMNLLGLTLSVFFLCAFWWMPDTPMQLLTLGHEKKARDALQWLRGKQADVSEEFRTLENTVKRRQAEDAASIRQLLADKASVKGLMIALALCANQPFSGFYIVLSYSVPIFKEASPSMSANVAASVVGLLLVLGSLVASRLVERAGRRVLLFISDTAMAVCLAVLGGHAYAQVAGLDVSSFSWVPVAALSLFMASVSLAVTTVPFVIITEIFLPQAQRLATVVGSIVILGFGFLATKFFNDLNALLGLHGSYWLFSLCCVAFALYLYFELPETKGRSLESIRKDLAGEKVNGPKETV